MPRPFPFPINVGTDLCHIPRIFNILTSSSKRGAAFTLRLLSLQELKHPKVDKYVLGPFGEYWLLKQLLRDILSQGEKSLKDVKGDLQRTRDLWKQGWKAHNKNDPWSAECHNFSYQSLRFKNHRIIATDKYKSSDTKDYKDDVPSAVIENVEDTKSPAGEPPSPSPKEQSGIPPGLTPQLVKLWYKKEEVLEQLASTELKFQKGAEFLAGRFAAKEAAIKAHRLRRLTFKDIRIVDASEGAVSAAPEAHIISQSQSWDDAQIVPINISHDGEYATAVCLSYEMGQLGATPATSSPDLPPPAFPNRPRSSDASAPQSASSYFSLDLTNAGN